MKGERDQPHQQHQGLVVVAVASAARASRVLRRAEVLVQSMPAVALAPSGQELTVPWVVVEVAQAQ